MGSQIECNVCNACLGRYKSNVVIVKPKRRPGNRRLAGRTCLINASFVVDLIACSCRAIFHHNSQFNSHRQFLFENGSSCDHCRALGGATLDKVDWSHCCRWIRHFLCPCRAPQCLAPAIFQKPKGTALGFSLGTFHWKYHLLWHRSLHLFLQLS